MNIIATLQKFKTCALDLNSTFEYLEKYYFPYKQIFIRLSNIELKKNSQFILKM